MIRRLLAFPILGVLVVALIVLTARRIADKSSYEMAGFVKRLGADQATEVAGRQLMSSDSAWFVVANDSVKVGCSWRNIAPDGPYSILVVIEAFGADFPKIRATPLGTPRAVSIDKANPCARASQATDDVTGAYHTPIGKLLLLGKSVEPLDVVDG